jgi:hypothetical protein
MTDDAPRRCYGQHSDRKDECTACPEAPWCRDAKDPVPRGGPGAGPSGDDAEYEVAVAKMAEEAATVDDTRERLGAALAMVLRMADGNPDRIQMFLGRISGASLSEIGAAQGKSKQAVAKDIAKVAEVGGEMVGRALRQRHPGSALSNIMVAVAVQRQRRVHPELKLCGEGGVYDRVARLFGLPSWRSVEHRARPRQVFAAAVDDGERDNVGDGEHHADG